MSNIFFQNYRELNGSFTGPFNEEWLTGQLLGTSAYQLATLHPVKIPAYQYRLHKNFLALESRRLRNKINQFQRRINEMNEILKVRHHRKHGEYKCRAASNSHNVYRRVSDGTKEAVQNNVIHVFPYAYYFLSKSMTTAWLNGTKLFLHIVKFFPLSLPV